jgi:hypothetical protein
LTICRIEKERREEMPIFEGVWDCPFCDRTNRGSAKHCGGCGAPRGEEVKFYLPKGARQVTDSDEIVRAKAGPDWTCEHCGGDNPVVNKFCDNCGAPFGSSSSREIREGLSEDEAREKPGDREGPIRPLFYSPPSKEKTGRSFFSPGQRMLQSRPLRIGGLAALIFALFVGAIYLLFVPHEKPLTITGFHWTREIEVEQYRTLTQQGWSGELPTDARILSQSYEIRTYRQVLDHYETRTEQVPYQECHHVPQTCYRDLGNGYFESYDCGSTECQTEYQIETHEEPVYRDEPVYDWLYTYEMDRWVVNHVEQSEEDDQNPSWPELDLGEKEREGRRSERYLILLVDEENKEYQREIEYQQWLTLQAGDECQGEFNSLGSLLSLECLPTP